MFLALITIGVFIDESLNVMLSATFRVVICFVYKITKEYCTYCTLKKENKARKRFPTNDPLLSLSIIYVSQEVT